MIVIEALEEKYLKGAVLLNQNIFPINYVDPKESIEASLDSNAMKNFQKILQKMGEPECRSLLYWVAVDKNTDTVLGTTGLYERVGDSLDMCWLGWFAVDPQYRGQGIGSQLLDFTFQKAREMKKNTIMLYTSTDPEENRAHEMYKKRGFFVRHDLGRIPEGKYEIFYMECQL